MRCAAGAVAAVLAAGSAHGQTERPEGGDPAGVEDLYLELLRDWALGSQSAAGEFSDLQQRVVDHGAGFEVTPHNLDTYYSGKYHRMTLAGWGAAKAGRRMPNRGCLGKIQNHLDARLADLDPEALLALAFFHHLLHEQQLTRPPWRPWLAMLSRERALWLGELYGEQARPRKEARRGAASMLAAVADMAANVGLLEAEERARDIYSWVLVIEPENAAGLYWSAFLAERAGDYEAAVRHLEAYRPHLGDDVEVALRLAINRARIGKGKEAAAALESIARGTGPEPWRIVAYQELGRWHGALSRAGGDSAVAYLREATAAFPGSERLRFQLSYRLRADWNESSALVLGVEEGWKGDTGSSPRALYNAPRRHEIDDEQAWLQIAVERRKESLAFALDELLEIPAEKRLRVRECPEGAGR